MELINDYICDMVTFTISEADNIEVKQLPESWGELDWPRYVAAVQCESERDILAALSGISKAQAKDLEEFQVEYLAYRAQFYWNTECPIVEIEPVDIGMMPWEDMNTASAEFERVQELGLHEVAAMRVIVRTYTGKDLNTMKAPEAAGYAAFFFNHSKIGMRGSRISTTTRIPTMRLPQGLRRYRHSDGSERLTPYAKATHLNMIICSKSQPLPSSINCYWRKSEQNILRASKR